MWNPFPRIYWRRRPKQRFWPDISSRFHWKLMWIQTLHRKPQINHQMRVNCSPGKRKRQNQWKYWGFVLSQICMICCWASRCFEASEVHSVGAFIRVDDIMHYWGKLPWENNRNVLSWKWGAACDSWDEKLHSNWVWNARSGLFRWRSYEELQRCQVLKRVLTEMQRENQRRVLSRGG